MALAAAALALLVTGVAVGQNVHSRYWDNVLKVRNTDVDKLEEVAYQWASVFDDLRMRASTPAQVSQVADEAGVAMQYALVKQNQEIIRLLRRIANEPK